MKKKTLIIIISAVVILAAGTLALTAAHKSGTDASASQKKSEASAGADSQDDAKIEQMIQKMSIEEKTAQMFMGCFYNGIPSSASITIESSDSAENNDSAGSVSPGKYDLGCVLLFGTAFTDTDKSTVKTAVLSLQADSNIAPFIAVDEEGGTVNRVSSSQAFRSEPFKSPRALYAEGGMDAIVSDLHEKNALLSEIGINLNLAPVLDIATDPNDFMYDRSLGQDAETTSEYAKAAVRACRKDNMGCCLKHFPGYGNSADTHNGIAVDNRSAEQIENNDMLPFETGIEAGASAVLVSHSIVSSIDSELPASLSPAIHRLLRKDLNFDGVIITDDLSMGAVTEFTDEKDSAVAAVLAGNDMLCTGDFVNQFAAVTEAVKSGTITEKRIDRSVRRILKWKKSLGII